MKMDSNHPTRRYLKLCLVTTLFFSLFAELSLTSLPALADDENPRQDKKTEDLLNKIPDSLPVEALADSLTYDRVQKKVIAIGNVIIKYKESQLTADKAEVYTDSRKAYAEGHVVVKDGDNVLKGDKVYYDFEHHQGSFPQGKFVQQPYYGKGDEIEQVSKDLVRVQGGSITTCDLDHPHYFIQSQRVKIYPNDKLVAYNVVFVMLGRPYLWLPFVTVPLNWHHLPFRLRAGYSKLFGTYVYVSKGWSLNKYIYGKAEVDWRSKRGVGFGLDAQYDFSPDYKYLGHGIIRSYITEDKAAPDPKAANPYAEKNSELRWRFQWRHRSDFDPYSNLIISHNNLSDNFLLQDFFQGEYDGEQQPKSIYVYTKNTADTGFMLQVDKRYNHFFTELEKLPEIRLTFNKKQIGVGNAYYYGETDMANLNQKFASSNITAHTFRFDTYHEINYPFKIGEFVFNPSVNMRDTEYSRGLQDDSQVSRQSLGMAMDLSTRYYKIYDVETNFLGMDIHKIRHIVEPYFHSEINHLTTVAPENLYPFDQIDALKRHIDEFKFGLENRLQTKRLDNHGKWHRVDVVSLNTYVSYGLNEDNPDASVFTTVGIQTQFRPYDWLVFENITNYDAATGVITDSDSEMEIMYKDKWDVVFSYQYLNEKDINGILGPTPQDLLTVYANYKLNEKWTIGGYVRYNLHTATLEEYEARLSRNLHCWLVDFGWNSRRSDRVTGVSTTSDNTVFITLTLTAFPEVSYDTGNRASISRPRIGTYVSGAEERTATSNVLTAQALHQKELENSY